MSCVFRSPFLNNCITPLIVIISTSSAGAFVTKQSSVLASLACLKASDTKLFKEATRLARTVLNRVGDDDRELSLDSQTRS